MDNNLPPKVSAGVDAVVAAAGMRKAAGSVPMHAVAEQAVDSAQPHHLRRR